MSPAKASTGRGSSTSSKKLGALAKRPAAAVRDSHSSRPTLETPTVSSTQQSLLDIFAAAFPAELSPNTTQAVLQPLLQEVKHHLYHRDFAAAFSRPELLRAYAVRWSASRALAYLDVFRDVLPNLELPTDDAGRGLNVTCLGGGAGAELVALAGLLSFFPASGAEPANKLAVTAIDVANWASLVQQLQSTISGNAGLENLDSSTFLVTSHVADLLDASESAHASVTAKALASSQLVTLMFTLNELYSSSISRAQKFLLDLSSRVAPGTLLLVVDSPGSFSTVGLGSSSNAARPSESQSGATQAQRKYPMSWLMDHALLKTAADLERDAGHADTQGPWEKLETVESRWFRLPEGLKYPIALENMRYQLHLFRRRAGSINHTGPGST